MNSPWGGSSGNVVGRSRQSAIALSATGRASFLFDSERPAYHPPPAEARRHGRAGITTRGPAVRPAFSRGEGAASCATWRQSAKELTFLATAESLGRSTFLITPTSTRRDRRLRHVQKPGRPRSTNCSATRADLLRLITAGTQCALAARIESGADASRSISDTRTSGDSIEPVHTIWPYEDGEPGTFLLPSG